MIEAPAYRNVYMPSNTELPVETDVTYYLVLRRKTHWLSEVCPLLVLAFVTIIPAVVTRPMEKLFTQLFCMAALFTLHKDLMDRLPPTSLVTPSAVQYVVALILYNLIHLILTIIVNNREECLLRIAQQIPSLQHWKKTSDRNKDIAEGKDEAEQNVKIDGQMDSSSDDKIVVICNWIILVLLISAVVISTLLFLFDRPHIFE